MPQICLEGVWVTLDMHGGLPPWRWPTGLCVTESLVIISFALLLALGRLPTEMWMFDFLIFRLDSLCERVLFLPSKLLIDSKRM